MCTGGELVAKGHSVHYSEGKSEHSLHMNPERQRSEQTDAGYGKSKLINVQIGINLEISPLTCLCVLR